jgi:hypothetical protein
MKARLRVLLIAILISLLVNIFLFSKVDKLQDKNELLHNENVNLLTENWDLKDWIMNNQK